MQLGAWSVDSEGQLYEISVTRAENGKDVLRVNGRVAAKPITPEETEIEIVLGGRMFVLYRQGPDKFDLQEGLTSAAPKSPAVLAREIAQRDDTLNAMTVLGESSAPLALSSDPLFKRLPLLGWIAIVAVIAGLMFYVANGPSYQKVASQRVNNLLTEMHASKGSSLAVKLWYNNKRNVDMAELMRASDDFDRWRQKKDLYRAIGEFTIVGSKDVDGTAVPTAIVHFVLEGNEYRVKVPKDLPIAWEE
jgi:hypothetical protein